LLPDDARSLDPIKAQAKPKTFRDYIARNYAGWIGDDGGLTSHMRWLPVSKRPALAVRWGVGVTMAAMTPRKAIRQAAELAGLTGPSGPGLVGVLAQRLDDKRDGAWSDMPDASLMKVPVFSAESEDALVDEAGRQSLDGLVMMSLTSQVVGISKTPRVVMVVRLVDVLARKTTWSSAAVNNQKIAATQGTAEDASVLLVRSVLAKLDEQFGLKPLPALSAAAVAQRASRLAATTPRPEAALRTLAELRYYQAGKLLKHDDAQRCYQALIGDEEAETLAGTDAEARVHTVEEWFQSRSEKEPRSD
jgi:hypothetical protein